MKSDKEMGEMAKEERKKGEDMAKKNIGRKKKKLEKTSDRKTAGSRVRCKMAI